MPTNFEFKARAKNIIALENKLKTMNPVFHGEDNQTDTYFNTAKGRLKLREGNIENALIQYERENVASAKQSNILLYQHTPDKMLKAILEKVLGVLVVVEKKRRIYFIDNVKFHFDMVPGLGEFVEVEAIDREDIIPISQLKEQCDKYAAFFNVAEEDYVHESYSDMVLKRIEKTTD